MFSFYWFMFKSLQHHQAKTNLFLTPRKPVTSEFLTTITTNKLCVTYCIQKGTTSHQSDSSVIWSKTNQVLSIKYCILS